MDNTLNWAENEVEATLKLALIFVMLGALASSPLGNGVFKSVMDALLVGLGILGAVGLIELVDALTEDTRRISA